MSKVRILLAAVIGFGTISAAGPASAQFFLTPHDMRGTPVHGDETGIGMTLPGATDAELRASLVWNLRAALNVAALQCDFEPTLLTQPSYNTVLVNHKDELKSSYDTLTKYFIRTAKSAKAGQDALDRFGTSTYSGFTTVGAQYGFCQTAGSIGRDAIFAPRGSLHVIAEQRMRELRNSLTPYGDQRTPRAMAADSRALLPPLDDKCWTKTGAWNSKKCGVLDLSAR